MTKHAALPWRPALGANEDGGVIVISMDETERNPCVCYGNTPKQALMNAFFVAHACNCHYELVAALQGLMEFWDNGTPIHPGALVVEEARAALAEAEGSEP